LASNNPTIDSFDFSSGRAVSIKSRDIEAGYADPKSLRRQLRRDINDVASYNGQADWAGVAIDSAAVKSRSLIVAIPGGASKGQYQAMVDAYSYGASKGVDVEFVIVR
jgi:hypothetical protein